MSVINSLNFQSASIAAHPVRAARPIEAPPSINVAGPAAPTTQLPAINIAGPSKPVASIPLISTAGPDKPVASVPSINTTGPSKPISAEPAILTNGKTTDGNAKPVEAEDIILVNEPVVADQESSPASTAKAIGGEEIILTTSPTLQGSVSNKIASISANALIGAQADSGNEVAAAPAQAETDDALSTGFTFETRNIADILFGGSSENGLGEAGFGNLLGIRPDGQGVTEIFARIAGQRG